MKYDGFDGVLRNSGPRSETTHRYSCRRIIEMLSPDLVYDLKLEWSLLRFGVGGQSLFRRAVQYSLFIQIRVLNLWWGEGKIGIG
ncbi:hypothetical protein CDAR_321671 [Caerostris darwini]|uniref:Uncharacterized protein n=1 Tax=Caerostris darwini TaxID=1538125 RepID=A0AAV4VWY8_9ARAC|nr:hypothetical protein CDAR_321671 [Caerostris darwini]